MLHFAVLRWVLRLFGSRFTFTYYTAPFHILLPDPIATVLYTSHYHSGYVILCLYHTVVRTFCYYFDFHPFPLPYIDIYSSVHSNSLCALRGRAGGRRAVVIPCARRNDSC